MTSPVVYPPADAAAPSLFSPGELELLREFVGLPPATTRLAALLALPETARNEAEDEDGDDRPDLRRSPVRLSDAELKGEDVPLADIRLAEAVGRLCTAAVPRRLATWYQPEAAGARIRFPRPLARRLRPRLLCTIRWSSWEWLEQYQVTWIQPLERFVVTVVGDTDEIWGCDRLALDAFGPDQPLLPACERVLSE